MSRSMAKKETKANKDHKMMMTMMNKILVKQENKSFLLILCRRESLAALPVTSEVNKDLGLKAKAKAKNHHQGQGQGRSQVKDQGQGLGILALRTKVKAKV